MKSNLTTNTLLALTIGALLYSVPWTLFFTEPARNYLWPGALAFVAFLLFQLQFRLASSGANARLVFVLCSASAAAMLLGLHAMAAHPGAEAFYIAGMALANTTMSRLYAMRLRKFGKVRVPWPIWRGNLAAMAEIDRQMRQAMSARSPAPSRDHTQPSRDHRGRSPRSPDPSRPLMV